MDRRGFLKGAAAFGAAGMTFESWCAAHGADFDYLTAGRKFGWSGKDPEAFTFLHATDLHMTENPDWDHGAMSMKDKFMGRCFIDEVNAMKDLSPRPFGIFLTGDLTSHTTMNSATWPRSEKKWAHYRKYVTDRLQLPWWQFIGNNDCASVPYKKVFPELPLYWTVSHGGIQFVGLHGYSLWKPENTNHAGILYDKEQLDWLRGVVASSKARTLVVMTHEPLVDGDSHAACAQIAPILAKFPGEEIWNVAGHGHGNYANTFELGGRTVRYVQTFTPVGHDFTVGDGGYRVFYCSDGLVRGSAIRWLTSAGEPIGYQPVDVRNSRRVRLAGEWSPEGSLAVYLVGRDPYDITGSVRIENRLADYYICRPDKKGVCGNLVWSVPRTVNGRKVARVRVNCGYIEGKAGVSSDGKDWSYAEAKWARGDALREIAIPDSFGGERVWLSLSNESKYECKFFGCALMA